MGLVDYSDSESDSETVTKPTPAPAATSTSKKPFQKLVGSGKIIVNLAGTGPSADTTPNDEPPAKRAKTAAGASRFSAFSSFLPPPKKAAAVAKPTNPPGEESSAPSRSSGGTAPRPGVHLRTGAEPAFSRDPVAADEADEDNSGGSGSRSAFSSGLNLPAPKKGPAGPTIPEGQKPADEVKLVGKPLMFKPLSVARKPGAKKQNKAAAAPVGATTASVSRSASEQQKTATIPGQANGANTAAAAPAEPPKRKKVSLFSMDDDSSNNTATKPAPASSNGTYEPLFTGHLEQPDTTSYDHDDDGGGGVTSDYNNYVPPPQQQPQIHQHPSAQPQQSLHSIADELALSAEARRELFGRQRGGGGGNNSSRDKFTIPENAKIVNFNMEKEYEHNEALRASGEQIYNPVRHIAPGKHSLRQIVSMAQNNQAALEDTFASGKNNRKDAAGRYGW